MRGCLTLPFRLAAVLLLAIGAWVAWQQRDLLRRWIHRATADAPAPEAGVAPEELYRRAAARLDTLERGRADSVMLSAGEVTALANVHLGRRSGGALDRARITLGEGTVAVELRVDGSRFPEGALGDLAEFVAGSEPVEASGTVAMRRLGMIEWRLASVRVRGVPLPRALWSRLVERVAPADGGAVTFDVPIWLTGLRVSRTGAVLYGGRAER